MTLQEITEQAKVLKQKHGWLGKAPEERLAHLISEVGEVANEVLRYVRAKDEKSRAVARDALGQELYDVVWNVCDLAAIADINIDEAFAKKVANNTQRKWQESKT